MSDAPDVRERAHGSMRVVPLSELAVPEIATIMAHGRPWLPESSDYWLVQRLHGSTSFAVFVGAAPVGGIIACLDAAQPVQLYIDQVAVHPAHRGKGVAQRLFRAAEARAVELGCVAAWLSSNPGNPAVHVWPRLGYVNRRGDRVVDGLEIHTDFKGPGKDRAVFEKVLSPPGAAVRDLAVATLINVDVPDLERAIRFYEEAVGLRLRRRLFAGTVAEMAGAAAPVYLLEKAAGSAPIARPEEKRTYERHWTPVHLDFVVQDLARAIAQAVNAGARLETGPQAFPWGRLATLSDPFGHGLCLLQWSGRGYEETRQDGA